MCEDFNQFANVVDYDIYTRDLLHPLCNCIKRSQVTGNDDNPNRSHPVHAYDNADNVEIMKRRKYRKETGDWSRTDYVQRLMNPIKPQLVELNDYMRLNESYMSCARYRGKELHNIFPIMIGSLADRLRRGVVNSATDPYRKLYGMFIINGMVVYINTFMSNDQKGGYVFFVKSTQKRLLYRWAVCDRFTLRMVNVNAASTSKPRLEVITTKTNDTVDHEALMKEYSPVDEKYCADYSEYEDYIRCYLDESPELDSLSNKTFTSPSKMLRKVFNWHMSVTKTHIKYVYENAKGNDGSGESRSTAYKVDMVSAGSRKRKHPSTVAIKSTGSGKKVLQPDDSGADKRHDASATKGGGSGCRKPPSVPSSATYRNIFDKRYLEKLQSKYRSGNLFYVYTNKNINYVNMAKNDGKTVYNPVEAHKLNNCMFLASITRSKKKDYGLSMSQLQYSDSYRYFICPLSIKEMKDAGENLHLTDMTIVSPKMYRKSAQDINVPHYVKNRKRMDTPLGRWLLKEYNDNETSAAGATTQETRICDLYRVVWNSYLTRFTIRRSAVYELKRAFPFIATTVIANRYLCVCTTGGKLMKYSASYKCFVTYEELKTLFPNAFDDMCIHARFHPILRTMPKSLVCGQMEKAVVGVNNQKGAMFEATNQQMVYAFLYKVGYNTALMHPFEPSKTTANFNGRDTAVSFTFPEESKHPSMAAFAADGTAANKYLSLAYLRHDRSALTGVAKRFLSAAALLIDRSDRGELDGYSYDDILNNAGKHFKEIEKGFERAVTGICFDGDTQLKVPSFDYRKRISGQLSLYAAYGDTKGFTNDDGIVMDRKLFERGPKILASSTLVATLAPDVEEIKNMGNRINTSPGTTTAINTMRPLLDSVRYYPIEKTTAIDGKVIFGLIIANIPLTLKCPRRMNSFRTSIKNRFMNIYIYILSVDTYNFPVDYYIYSEFRLTQILCNYRYVMPLTVGCKLSDKHGQKCEISAVADLSGLEYVDNNGNVVHPQLLFSSVSTVARMVVPQIYESFAVEATVDVFDNQSKRTMPARLSLAYSPKYNSICAPISFNVHNIIASRECNLATPRIDLLTREHGILANSLLFTLQNLIDQDTSIKKKNENVFSIVQQLYAKHGSLILPL